MTATLPYQLPISKLKWKVFIGVSVLFLLLIFCLLPLLILHSEVLFRTKVPPFRCPPSKEVLNISTTTSISTTTTSTTTTPKPLPPPPKICNTRACKEAGDRLFASLNSSVDPCNNFYEYACGGWVAAHSNPIPGDKPSVTPFELVKDKLAEKLKKIFEDAQNLETLTETPASVKLAVDLYAECTDEDARNKLGIDPLKDIFSQVFGSSKWPILEVESPLTNYDNVSNSTSNSSSLTSFTEVFRKLQRFAITSPLVSFAVKADGKASGDSPKKLVHVSCNLF